MSIKNERLLSRAKKLTLKGEISKAQEIYDSILKSYPNNKEAKKGLSLLNQKKEGNPTKEQLNIIINLYSSGQLKEALSAIDQLMLDYPREPLLFNISGACYSADGSIDSAIISFKKAISLRPDYAEAHYNLGVAFHTLRQLNESVESYKKAIFHKHSYPTAHNNLGLISLERGQVNNAIKNFEWAIAYSPEYAEAHNSLGAAYQELKQFEDAKKYFEKAISLNSNYAQAFNNLGILSEIINLPNEALAHYEKVISINPDFVQAYRNITKLKKIIKEDPLILQMLDLYKKDGLNRSDKASICFALSKVNEDLGNSDQFFKFLNEGSRLRKEELNYSISESKNFHIDLIKVFSSSLTKIKKPSTKTSDIQPIFIVGMPRSGTTLVEQIISSHHAVHGAGELTNFKEIISPILEDHLNQNKSKILKEDLLSIRQQYLDSLSHLNVTEEIVTDKMPMNFRLIGFILSAMPEAKIIHLKRDAIATCWSNYNHYFTSGNGFTFNQEDLAKFYNMYTDLMEFWHQLFPKKIYDISYEELTINQKDETQKLLNYCELDWDENCLDFHKNKRGIETASASQVRQKMYQGSSEAWKKYEKYLQPFVKGLSKY